MIISYRRKTNRELVDVLDRALAKKYTKLSAEVRGALPELLARFEELEQRNNELMGIYGRRHRVKVPSVYDEDFVAISELLEKNHEVPDNE